MLTEFQIAINTGLQQEITVLEKWPTWCKIRSQVTHWPQFFSETVNIFLYWLTHGGPTKQGWVPHCVWQWATILWQIASWCPSGNAWTFDLSKRSAARHHWTRDLSKILYNKVPKGVKMFFMCGACHSGPMAPLPYRSSSGSMTICAPSSTGSGKAQNGPFRLFGSLNWSRLVLAGTVKSTSRNSHSACEYLWELFCMTSMKIGKDWQAISVIWPEIVNLSPAKLRKPANIVFPFFFYNLLIFCVLL